MRQSLRLGSISGIPVGINWGLLLIAGFYIFNLAVGLLPAAVPGSSTFSYWVFASVSIVLFFASILAHELGHAIVAQRNGIRVRAITLWFLGGVAELEKEADDPGVEFRIAIAGPAVSVAAAVLFGSVALISSFILGGDLLTFSLGYLGVVNLVLAVFNLIPAAPLDGGRVLTSILWRGNRNKHEARATAAKAGQVFGNALLAIGILGLFTGNGTFVLAILGFFLRAAAGAERNRAETLNRVETSGVATTMFPLVAPITRGLTVAGLESMASAYDKPVAFPIWGPDGVDGLVPSTAVANTPPQLRTEVLIQDQIIEWSDFSSAFIDESMPAVLERAQASGKRHVLVYNRAGEQVGYIDLAGVLSLQPV